MSSTILGIIASGGAAAAAGTSFESIATGSGTGSSGTITFSTIPAGFKHLQIRGIGRSDNAVANVDLIVRFNSDSGANYAYHAFYGSGSTIGAFAATSQTMTFMGTMPGSTATANRMGVAIIDILDFNSSTKNKTLRSFNGRDMNGSGDVYVNSSLWMNTNAITSVTVNAGLGNWTTATQFALYGIKESA